MKLSNSLIATISVIIFTACNGSETGTSSKTNNINDQGNNNVVNAPAEMTYEIVRTYPHDTSSYTEGLEWNNNILIESTGNYGKSKLILMDSNMKPIQNPVKLSDTYFGEGTTLFKDKIYQLTYKEHKVFVYDAKTLNKINEFEWPYEGWGMTHNDTSIILNTGGSSLYFVDPTTFKKIKTVEVFDNNGYIANINELEYVDGKLFANVWLTDKILQIDPNTGEVKAIADMTNILAKFGYKYDQKFKDEGNVLNGIAFKKEKGTFYVTGKKWPLIFELKFKDVK
jgi:glutamine cyclotransferase